jgi:short-subunit dehydrogenase
MNINHSVITGWMASPHHNIYHATKHFVRAFSEALSLELRAYPGVVNTQIMPGPTQTQWPTRADAEETVMFGMPGGTNDPKQVALAAYQGLCKRKRMVFSSWGDAASALFMQLAPRSVHLTITALMNSPTRGLARMPEPEKDQGKRGEKLACKTVTD